MINNDFILRLIKIVDIAYIFTIYAVLGCVLSAILNKINNKYDKEIYNKKSLIIIILEIAVNFAVIGITVYVAKNLFERLPFPFDGIKGFDHKKVKEINTAIPLTYTILFLNVELKKKLYHVAKKFKFLI